MAGLRLLNVAFVIVALLTDNFKDGESFGGGIEGSLVFFHLGVDGRKFQVVHDHVESLIDECAEVIVRLGERIENLRGHDVIGHAVYVGVHVIDDGFQIAGGFFQFPQLLIGTSHILKGIDDYYAVNRFAAICRKLEDFFGFLEVDQRLVVVFLQDAGNSR